MKKYTLFFGLLFLIYACVPAASVRNEVAVPVSEGPVYEETLDNGLKVLIIQDASAPLAVFQVWYDAGSIHEQIGKTGLSHLLEHMMFKGTERHGPKTFSRMIKRVGGLDNAGTSKDYVFYYQKLAPDRLELSIKLEADRMQNLLLDHDETLSERDVVMEERRMRYEDDPQNLVYEEVVSAAFKNHPYRWPVIGWMQDLQNASVADLREYYSTRYVPNNAFIIVAGNIDLPAVMASIKREFGKIPRGPQLKPLDVQEPVQRGERRVYVRKEAELPYVLSSYRAPNIESPDSFALEVLAVILSDGKSSRIYKNLVDGKRLALSAGAWYSSTFRYPYLFSVYGTPLPGKSIDELEAALYEELEALKKEAPSEREVQKARNQAEADFIMGQDSIFYQARVLAEFELLGDWRLKDEYLEGIRNVKPEDVQRVAQKYLVQDQRTTGTLIPVINKE
ncbi:MAG: insulinase family protein [Nitrospira sp.]|nr:insulinase family protein [Nitrospira sp.]